MNIWEAYKKLVYTNLGIVTPLEKDMSFWRDYLFAVTIIYVAPLSLIALIPSVYVSFQLGQYLITAYDVVAATSLLLIIFSRNIPIAAKKLLFTLIIYGLAIVLLTVLGSFGPGLIYMLTASLIMVIIFRQKYAFASVYINTFICLMYGVVIYSGVIDIHQSDQYNLMSWLAISFNVVFISAIFAILIPRMFGSMQQTIEHHRALKNEIGGQKLELQQSLRELKTKNHELEQFAYVASHDLQEPLRMISSFMSLLDKKYSPQLDDKARQYIYYATDGARRMRQIILDLLEFSRVGKHYGEKQLVDLNKLIDNTIFIFTRTIDKKEARVLRDDLPRVYSYAAPLEQIFQNLISNGLKYNRGDCPPDIHISAEEKDDCWIFSVHDKGIGIAEEHHENVFSIFERFHASDSSNGTGMGLAIVKKEVESLGGKIWLESTPGTGSTFFFTLGKTNETSVSN